MGPIIFRFRSDLRLADNPALQVACATAGSDGIIPVFVWSPDEQAQFPPGPASRRWLHGSLKALGRSIEIIGGRLVLRTGPTEAALLSLAEESGARGIYWNSTLEPAATRRDAQLARAIHSRGLSTAAEVAIPPATSLFKPEALLTNGRPHLAFAPFWRACLLAPAPARPLPAPVTLVPPQRRPLSLALEDLALVDGVDRADVMLGPWTPGEGGATTRLQRFLERLAGYAHWHDEPAAEATSHLSPHLHLGEISPREVWHAVRAAAAKRRIDPIPFLRAFTRREFCQHVLHHFPTTVSEPMLAAFAHFGWLEDASALRAWQRGLTGYPFVDAGMRELAQTGYMHNRVRMVTASFLVKHLLVSWKEGARWFWDTSLDADLATNTFGWQQCAGSGSLVGPIFRFLSPATQGATFDRDGAYVRRWVPELARLSPRFIHAPWTAPPKALTSASVTLGRDYPWPIVDARAARQRALAAFEAMRHAARAGS